jgi:hypothetical protein
MENSKAKQIEAIACALEDVCLDAKDCSLVADCDVCRAEKLYDAGCRMIGDTVLELPCKLGEDVYVIKRCHCGNPDCFKAGSCNKRVVARTPKVLERRMILERKMRFRVDELGRVVRDIDAPVGTICYTVYKKPFTLDMIADLGKTVFASLEDTKEALYEIWRKAK